MEPGKKILLVDDDPVVAQLIRLLVGNFRDSPYSVEHVPDYASGLERLLSGNYVLCLLDKWLGDGDGLQLLREAKARQCATPIILLTGDDNEQTDVAAMESGAADFISKDDLKPDSFERAVEYAIQTAAERSELRARQKPGPGA